MRLAEDELVVRVTTAYVDRMARRASAEHWQRDLFDARLPLDLDGLDLAAAEPAARALAEGLAALHAGVARLRDLEGRRIELERRHPWATGQVSPWVWAPAGLGVAASIQWYGLMGFVFAVVGLAVLAGVGFVALAVHDARRRGALAEVVRLHAAERASLARKAREVLKPPLDVVLAGRRYLIETTD